MREANLHDLADKCEMVLDNPPTFDGFRPCNSALYHTLIKSLKVDDMFVMQTVTYGDDIGLRNRIWNAMTGDECNSKKLMAMSQSTKLTDIFYKFERHGIKRYFAKIHEVTAKLKMLGAQKQDWEVFAIIFDHMVL